MSLPDHFELFDLPVRFQIDLDQLERSYRNVQARVHPDRHAAGTAGERRVAMQWASRANEAYRTLKSPQRRAAYLCERAGVPIEAESNTAMPGSFLMQQLEWREAVGDARESGEPAALERIKSTMQAERDRLQRELGAALDDEQDHALAATLVRQLMFIDKLAAEIGLAEHDREDRAFD
jgi:molecular chaperone HscB